MTNYDITAGTSDLNFQTHELDFQLLSRVVDFAKFTGSAAGAAADTADILTIPAGFTVEEVYYKILVASTTSSSVFGAGDSADSTYYFPNTVSATATAGTIAKTVTTATASKFKGSSATAATLVDLSTKLYSTADKLRVVLGATAPLNGKVQFVVRGVQTF